MIQIADDPRIRQAENDGWGAVDEICCPVCGEECETVYLDKFGDACGCEHCMHTQDSYDWYQDELEKGRPE